MSIPNHVSTTEVVLLELEILLTIIAIGAWGALSAIFYAKIRKNIIVLMKVLNIV
ncbi:Uncharacterised protein [Salmonella enterica subsp. diarizonae]|uniref:Uncharacterized protein n=1 Tax=Salmonella diarizonae TaxID=59204 RepID=A0A379U3U0_SALDZ|nr:Uncharacterised protein [Salmonella enterica subsp. diarizonae]